MYFKSGFRRKKAHLRELGRLWEWRLSKSGEGVWEWRLSEIGEGQWKRHESGEGEWERRESERGMSVKGCLCVGGEGVREAWEWEWEGEWQRLESGMRVERVCVRVRGWVRVERGVRVERCLILKKPYMKSSLRD